MIPVRYFSIKALFLLFIISTSPSSVSGDAGSGDIHVEIKGLRNSSGSVRISLFDSNKGFPIRFDKALRSVSADIKESMAQGEFTDIPFGDYAITVLHDENGNGRMDLKWGMVPAEGHGVSNNPEPGMLPPGFNESRFTLGKERLTIIIDVDY